MASSKKPQSSDLPSQVENLFKAWVRPGHRLVLGLSGGVDSVVLLDVLAHLRENLGFKLSVLHVNHQISPHAGNWAEFSEGLCQAYGVPFRVEVVRLDRQPGESLERVARDARYQLFSNQSVDFVVLAQHLDDQAETLLLQLLRGAGVKGLSAMPTMRDGSLGTESTMPDSRAQSFPPRILRPLLEISRREIESYAISRNLQWIQDESNENISFDRNYLRHRIFPLLEKRFPAYRKIFHRTSQHLAEASALLKELAEIDAQRALVDGRLRLDVLSGLSHPRAKNLLRYYFERQGLLMPSTDRLDEILRQLKQARVDARVQIVLGDSEIRRFQGQVYVFKKTKVPVKDLIWSWQGEAELKLGELESTLSFACTNGQGVSLEKLQHEPVTVRLRQGGERLRPHCTRPSRSLKNLLQEMQMPPWQRHALPLLYSGDHLVFAPGIGVDCAYQADEGEPSVLVNWIYR